MKTGHSGTSALKSGLCGTFNPSTMIEMMMAMTPSVKASRQFLPIFLSVAICTLLLDAAAVAHHDFPASVLRKFPYPRISEILLQTPSYRFGRSDSHPDPDNRFRYNRDHGPNYPVNNASMTNVDSGLVMMMLFLAQYSGDGGTRIGISSTDIQELLLQMQKHHTLHGHSCNRDELNTHQASGEPEHIASDTTQPIAAASR